MRRKKRIDDELRKVSDHLFYEVWMFNILADSMMSGIFGEGVLNNAVLESFCVHSRVILDFLFSQKPKKDDVVAEDFYIRSDEWYKHRPRKSSILRSIHKRVGQEVAHLTYHRQGIPSEVKKWNFIQIKDDINAVLLYFLNTVPKNLLSQSWSNHMVQINNIKPSKVYYIYENWVAEGHKARIHYGHCPYCNYGKGIHGSDSKKHGRWHGPFSTSLEVEKAAIATGGRVSKCKHCFPE